MAELWDGLDREQAAGPDLWNTRGASYAAQSPEMWQALMQQAPQRSPSLWPGAPQMQPDEVPANYDVNERAAQRVRQSVVPEGGRKEGIGTDFVTNYYGIPAAAKAVDQFANQLAQQSENVRTDPTNFSAQPYTELMTAMLGVGGPYAMLAKEASLGASGGKLIQPGGGEALAPPFYSAVQRAVEGAKLGKGTPEQWTGYLRNQPGVKAEEMDWLFGNLPKEGMLTKEQMQAHAAENAVTLGEVNKGSEAIRNLDSKYAIPEVLALERQATGGADIPTILANDSKAYYALTKKFPELKGNEDWAYTVAEDVFGKAPVQTKFQQWQLPGGENYRETLLTLPSGMPEAAKATIEKYNLLNRKMADQMAEWKGLAEANPPGHQDTLGAYARLAATRREAHVAEDAATKVKQQYRDSTFRSSHWDEPNVLAHIRMNDREVPGVGKSLHLEEIQSDWHQKGRQQGYNVSEAEKARMTKELEDVQTERSKLVASSNITDRARYAELNQREGELLDRYNATVHDGVPNAPFKSTWADVSLKRMIREASEKGYDAVSWTPGEAQAARYRLSNQLKELQYRKNENGTYEIGGTTKSGDGFNHPDMVTAEKLPDVVGKEMAQKIINDEGKKTRGQNYSGGYFDNVDLQVGGEGMKAFYDKMLVDKANALGKKHGARVEQSEITKPEMKLSYEELQRRRAGETPDPSQFKQPVHVLRITPQLREAAMKGFPLFSLGAGGAALAPGLFNNDAQPQVNMWGNQ